MFKAISAYSKVSILANRHPLEKIIFSIFPIVVLGYSKDYFPLFMNILVFIIVHFKSKNPRSIVFKFTLGTALFAAISSITFMFDYGAYSSGIIILKALNGGICLSYLVLTTPTDYMLLMVSKFKPLKDVCDIAKNMERFIFLIEDEYATLVNAVRCRGGFDSFKDKVLDAGKIAGLLLVNTLKRWREINNAVNARCYKGSLSYLQIDFSLSINRLLLICGYNAFLLLTLLYI